VRSHGQLVDHDPVGVSNSSTASTPTTASSSASRSASPAPRARAPPTARGRRDDLDADAVGLHGLDDRPGGALAVRGAGDHGGELALERDELLGEQPHAAATTSAASAASCTTQTPLPS
jgi:hypothetical protein